MRKLGFWQRGDRLGNGTGNWENAQQHVFQGALAMTITASTHPTRRRYHKRENVERRVASRAVVRLTTCSPALVSELATAVATLTATHALPAALRSIRRRVEMVNWVNCESVCLSPARSLAQTMHFRGLQEKPRASGPLPSQPRQASLERNSH